MQQISIFLQSHDRVIAGVTDVVITGTGIMAVVISVVLSIVWR